MGKLKVRGAWVGVLEVDLEQWTVRRLKYELSIRSNIAADSINVISEGLLLMRSYGNPNLGYIGVQNNSEIWFSRIRADEGQFLRQLQEAVTTLAATHADEAVPYKDYSLDVANQAGIDEMKAAGTYDGYDLALLILKDDEETKSYAKMEILSAYNTKLTKQIGIKESSARMGLLMLRKAKQLMREKSYQNAIQFFEMAEEAFAFCDRDTRTAFWGLSFMQVEIVWSYFMLGDEHIPLDASERLSGALKIIRDSGYIPPRASPLKMRIELLQGVIALRRNEFITCKKLLTSAEKRLNELEASSTDKYFLQFTESNLEEKDKRCAWLDIYLGEHNDWPEFDSAEFGLELQKYQAMIPAVLFP